MDDISVLKEIVSILEKSESPLYQSAIIKKVSGAGKSLVTCSRWIFYILALHKVVNIEKVGPVKIVSLHPNYKENFQKLLEEFKHHQR